MEVYTKMDNNGKISSSLINTAVMGIVLIVVLFTAYANIVPTAQDAGDSLNASEVCASNGCFYDQTGNTCNVSDGSTTLCARPNVIPFAGLFSGTGITFVIIMASLIILVVRQYMKGRK